VVRAALGTVRERFEDISDQAGKANEHFLDAELFVKAFLRPCESMRSPFGAAGRRKKASPNCRFAV